MLQQPLNSKFTELEESKDYKLSETFKSSFV